ncbi:MAG: polysaccharide deacetylase family protein [Lachnospiraceae bacterium]|nr:polysaccharide deacetylase family protein [Lachnospiraceae bacterium]
MNNSHGHTGKKSSRAKRRKMRKIRHIVVRVALLFLAMYFAYSLAFGQRGIKVTPIGVTALTIDIGTHYNDKGAKAHYEGILPFSGKDLVVEKIGSVDTSAIGDYKIVYRATYRGKTAETARLVRVRDLTAPVIELQTKDDYYTPFGHPYEEEGFTATDAIDGDLTNKVTVEELSNGTVLYTVEDKSGNIASVIRKIPYDDRVAPEITLAGEELIRINLEDPYVEPGFTAVDDCDGNVTAGVTVSTKPGAEANETIYVYEAKDSHGNVSQAFRTVVRRNPSIPLIELTGDENMVLTGGLWYKEPGYTATDKEDGDITENVTVEGEVEYYHVGTYTLTYRVKDSEGNETSVQRTVTVQSLGDPYANIVSTGGKTIYLTFDDGPSAHTKRLLEVLRKYGVKATFFVTGNHSEYRDRIVEAAADGHTIAVHTYTHNYSVIYKGEKAYFDDFNKVNDIIEDLTGKRATIMRFPGGSSNTISKKSCEGVMTKLVQDMNDLGIQYQDWNVLSGDASSTPIDTAKVISNVKNGITYNSKNDRASIVLQHDTVGYSVDAVESVIKWALENGYTFLPLSMDSPHAHQKVAN